MQQHVRFVFLIHQICSSLLNNTLQVVSVFLQLMQHAVHYVKFSTQRINVTPCYRSLSESCTYWEFSERQLRYYILPQQSSIISDSFEICGNQSTKSLFVTISQTHVTAIILNVKFVGSAMLFCHRKHL